MVNKIIERLKKMILDIDSSQLYIAISGGIDSMVLTNLCLENNLKPHLLHCNFKLRDKASDLDEAFIVNFAQQHNLQVSIKAFNTAEIAKLQSITIQECARNLRYDWFQTILVDKNSYLLTAHHLNDSIETFYINTLRGTGIKGLAGIPKTKRSNYSSTSRFY